MLRVVDVSSNQGDIDPGALDCDAVIVKATGGTSYENPHWRQWADRVLESGKLLGLYHYAAERGRMASARDEADHFLDKVRDYAGLAVLALDFEADAQRHPVSWAREWLDRVRDATGATPWFYAYAGYLNSRDHSEIAEYPLWMASYLYRYQGAGWTDPVNTWPTSDWGGMTCYQYTSTGRIGGYGGDLDLSVFYGGRGDWLRMEGAEMVKRNEVAAAIHRHMCECPKHGYTQGGARWGQGPNGPCYVEVYGRTYEIPGNDFDCSSSVKKAWEIALQGSPYEGVLGYNGYDKDGNWQSWYTGNEVWLFTSSGLFTWEPTSFIAETGDLYLNEASHVAMCQTQVPDVLSEFSINEFGDITGGQIGDQTGGESRLAPYYDFPWNGILHYNGLADEEDDMRPNEVWEYNYQNSAPGGNCYNALMETAYAVAVPHDSAAGDGTNGSMKDRIDYIDMRVKEIHDQMAELKKALALPRPTFQIGGSIDYGKLASAIADEMSKRMAE